MLMGLTIRVLELCKPNYRFATFLQVDFDLLQDSRPKTKVDDELSHSAEVAGCSTSR